MNTSEQFREIILGILVRSREQWSLTVSGTRQILIKDNGRWLRNIEKWLKLVPRSKSWMCIAEDETAAKCY